MDNNPYRDFGVRLQQMRSRRGLSALALARLVGCSVSSIFRWEAGADLPSVKFGKMIARVLYVSEEEILCRG